MTTGVALGCQSAACSVRLTPSGMTVAAPLGVMPAVYRIRWALTVFFLECAIRAVLLGAFLARSPSPSERGKGRGS